VNKNTPIPKGGTNIAGVPLGGMRREEGLKSRASQSILPPPFLDQRLSQMERVFRSPPFTKTLVQAIQLIAPHYNFSPTEFNRLIWEIDQNGACWAEFEALKEILSSIEKPVRILEIGPGLGRSLVFFVKKLGWESCEIHTYEGDGHTTKYTANGPRFDNSFCGNISELRAGLAFNGIDNVSIHDAKHIALNQIPGPFHLVYGFYNIGYHWSLEHFLDDILTLLGERAIAIFTVLPTFQPFKALEQTFYRVINKQRISPPGTWEKLIIVSKQPLPANSHSSPPASLV
jgi:hypothetical protein